MTARLSKSQFLRGLQCHKSLWLYKFRPELRTPPDASRQAVFDAGTEVGLLARQLFPGGEEIQFEGNSFGAKLERTRALVEGGAKTIYEATFRHDDVLVMVDILHKGEKGWELYEVKSSTEVKGVHEDDVALQYYVVTGAGIPLVKASLVHIDREYIRQGEIDPSGLFIIEDLTERTVADQGFVRERLAAMREMIGGECPPIDIGPYCQDPYDCDFMGHCWAHIPRNSVFDLTGKGIDKFASYYDGRVRFDQLDRAELSDKQRMQVEAALTGKMTIDRASIGRFLSTLTYPLSFLDFEALYNEPIPPFDGTRPYGRIPFQYSIHLQEREGENLQHFEFLSGPGDPRERIAEDLCRLIPEGGSVLTYNMAFEKGIITELAALYPNLKERLLKICDEMRDLMVPFRERLYYTKEMAGSYSLKYVLPALLPELGYKGMAVKNGDEAVLAYKRMVRCDDLFEAASIRKDLLEYCGLDTYAMVRLLEKLKEEARQGGP